MVKFHLLPSHLRHNARLSQPNCSALPVAHLFARSHTNTLGLFSAFRRRPASGSFEEKLTSVRQLAGCLFVGRFKLTHASYSSLLETICSPRRVAAGSLGIYALNARPARFVFARSGQVRFARRARSAQSFPAL